MGSVYRVRDTELKGALVVLKLLHPELGTDKELFERFRNEVLLARSLVHPNIARTYDIGRTEDGSYFLTMEYIEGDSLKDRIRRTTPGESRRFESDEIDFAVSILEQLLAGIGHAHEQGIIHRDLKPANVLVTSDGRVKIVDFGTARLLSDNAGLTKTGEIIGTPAYMPPEQIENRAIDHRCDLYATAIIGFELAAGSSPFAADTYIQSLYKQVHEPLPLLSSRVSGVPGWYEQVIKKGAAKSAGDRFSSADEFRAALRQTSPQPATVQAPSRAGNLLWLGLFVCTVLGFGSYLAWIYSPPPKLGGTKKPLPEGALETATADQPVDRLSAEKPNETVSEGPVAADEKVDGSPTDNSVTVNSSPGETPSTKEKLPPAEASIDNSTVHAKPEEAAAADPSSVLPTEDSKVQLYLRLPGLSPNDRFSATEAQALRWIGEIRGNKTDVSGLKPVLSIFQSVNSKRPMLKSTGRLLQASPEIKFGGRVSESIKLEPGNYTAVLDLIDPAAQDSAKFSGRAEFTILAEQ